MHRRTVRRTAAVLAAMCLLPAAAAGQEATVLNEITVTGTREGELKSETPSSVSLVESKEVEEVKPSHPMEIINRVPGALVMPTNGEGHTTAIRQPITTAPVYQFLEDGIPIRASGFFNHNALYEVNVPQAGGIEVVRGPGTALQGSDAIGGVINVLTKAPTLEPEAQATFEGGSFGWLRFLGTASDTFGDSGFRGDLNITHSDGWRDDSGYDRQSATLRWDQMFSSGAVLKTVLAGSNIDQATGASSNLQLTDFKSDPTINYTPIAYRKVQAVRLSSAYEQEFGDSLLSVTPYLRWNEMELLPSWQLSYDPVLYNTGHRSLGLLARYRQDFEPWRTRLVTGIDLDASPGYREEWKLNTTKTGKIFTSYTLGDKVYDYDVTFFQASPYVHAETSPVDKLRLAAGLRFDLMRYDYDNNLGELQTGNWRRPASTTLDYSHLSPSVGATYELMPTLNVFADYKHAFRVPSESQLFRQGGNVDSLGLEPIKADSFELGFRRPEIGGLSWEVSAYYMIKRDDILTFRDDVGTTSTNGGETRHYGLEVAVGWAPTSEWRIDTAASVSRHTYESWIAYVSSLKSNVDFGGKDIPLAPEAIATTTLGWRPAFLPGSRVELEWSYLSGYFIDDANTATYDGHNLLALRAAYDVNTWLTLHGRIYNLTDELWATTGSVSSGVETYSPGMPRTFYAGFTVKM